MKTQFGLVLSLMTVLVLSGCGKEITVEGLKLDSQQDGSNGKVGVSGQLYTGPNGEVQFAEVNPGVIQMVRNCAYDSAWCAPGFQLKLNDANSIYTRTLSDGSSAKTTATGDLNQLVLTTFVKKSKYTETFTLSNDPCGEGLAKGLQVMWEKTDFVQGGEVSTETCHAYY